MRSSSPRMNVPRGLENSRKPSQPWWQPLSLAPMPPKPATDARRAWRRRDAGGSGARLAQNLLGGVAAHGVGVQRQRALAAVDVGDGLVERVVGYDRHDGTGDLVAHDADILRPVDRQVGGHAPRLVVHRAVLVERDQRRLTRSQALKVEKSVGRVPVRLVSADIHSSLQLSLEQDIYAYDACFLSCAQELSCPLLTLDRRMKQVAKELGIRVLE